MVYRVEDGDENTADSDAAVLEFEVLVNWAMANLLSDDTGAPYRYNSGTWSTSQAGSMTYRLGSINLYHYRLRYGRGPDDCLDGRCSTRSIGSTGWIRSSSTPTGTSSWGTTPERFSCFVTRGARQPHHPGGQGGVTWSERPARW